MSKFSTSLFTKVLRWHESGEVENGYLTLNFSYFAIYLPQFIKIGLNFTKFWQTQFCTGFFETRYIMYKQNFFSFFFLSFFIAFFCQWWRRRNRRITKFEAFSSTARRLWQKWSKFILTMTTTRMSQTMTISTRR